MKLIHPLIIIRILSMILLIGTIMVLSCLPVAMIYGEPLYPFLFSSLLTGVTGIIFWVAARRAEMKKITTRDGYISVTLSWIVLSILCAVPYMVGGTIPSFIDAFFEASSGVTTTGASVFSNVEILPKSILFWRSLTHWIGGLGIVLLVIIILPSLHISAQQLMTMESSIKEKILPKTKSIGFRLMFVYLGLTVSEILLLSLGDMDLFDSVCHSFATIATGGFSTRNNSIAAYSVYSQNIISLFMFLSGVNFLLYYFAVKRNFRKVFQNEELWFYLSMVIFAGLLVSLTLKFYTDIPLVRSIETGFFQVISIVTSTGFTTTDYGLWPNAAITVLFLTMFTGACSGSTTGGIKVVRHLVVIKNLKNNLQRIAHPNVIRQVSINGNTVPEKVNLSILSFVMVYIIVFFIGTFLILLTGVDTLTATSGSIASLGNIGAAFGNIGPAYGFSNLPEFAKLVMSLLMIIGRLELLTVFAIFTRSFWRL